MSLFAYVLTRIRVFFDAFTRFAYARFLRIFWFAYLRAALYVTKVNFGSTYRIIKVENVISRLRQNSLQSLKNYLERIQSHLNIFNC